MKHGEIDRSRRWAYLAQIEKALGRTLEPVARRRWLDYFDLFESWSLRVNLVSAKDREKWIERHVLPSLVLGRKLGFPVANLVLDLGTGAGFPGLPIALAWPRTELVLVDAKRWRVLFVEEVVDALGLHNVRVQHARVESPEFQERWRGMFGLVLARAVADLVTLWKWSEALLSVAGRLVTVKGILDVDREAEAFERAFAGQATLVTEELNGKQGSILVTVKRVEDERC